MLFIAIWQFFNSSRLLLALNFASTWEKNIHFLSGKEAWMGLQLLFQLSEAHCSFAYTFELQQSYVRDQTMFPAHVPLPWKFLILTHRLRLPHRSRNVREPCKSEHWKSCDVPAFEGLTIWLPVRGALWMQSAIWRFYRLIHIGRYFGLASRLCVANSLTVRELFRVCGGFFNQPRLVLCAVFFNNPAGRWDYPRLLWQN